MPAGASNILLSIAIPTKNRQAYLKNLVDELLLSTRHDFEIVIQDNSDDDRLAAYTAALNDPRVRYSYSGEWISVVDNCDASIRACSGHFVCMLGDDDGIMLEESLDVLSQAKACGIDAVMSTILLYTWPDLSHHSISGLGGKLYLKPLLAGNGSIDVRARARGVVARSGAMGLEGLPCVYQGFVSRAVLSAVAAKTGSSFPGPSPDMANAVAISIFLRRPHFVPATLIISGHSRNSGAGQGTMKEHRGAIAAQRHLPADTAEKWYPQIPFFWSGPTIYAQSLHSAIARTGATALGRPGGAYLYAACFVFEPSYARETWRALRESGEPLWLMVPKIAYYTLAITLKRVVQLKNNLLVRYLPKRGSIAADSIADAIKAVRSLPRREAVIVAGVELERSR